MNKEIIGLLFGVEGGADVGKGSGKLIVKDLTDIVKKINAGSTSVPKLSLSIDIEETTKGLKAAINEITSALGGGAIKFTGLEKIESSLDAIAGGSERLAKGLVMIFGKLDSILNSMPGDFDLTSKSAVKSIEAITGKVNDLVAGIEALSATVTEISQKPSSIVNNIIGGTSEDLERLSLLKQKAKEIMSAYADTYRVVSSISGTSTLTGAYTSRYKSGGRAAEAMSAQAKLFNGAVASSETIEKVKDINSLIQEYGRSINELIDVMEIANSRGANLFVPDYSNYKRASDALKEYDARQKEATPDSSSPEAKSVLEHAKDISAACTSIEERLDLLRAKIEATFDFSTITPDVTNILTVLDEAKEKVGEIKKKSSQPGGSSDEKEASGFNSKDRLKTIKAYLQALTEVQKSVQKGGVGFDEDSGKFKAINDAYKNRVELVNKLKEEVEKLGVEIDAQSGLVIKPEAEELEGIAKKLGVTKEKFEKFYDDIGKEGLKTAGKVEKSTQSTVNSTSKQVRNARQEVLRMYDTISKDPASKKIANEILKMTKSGVVNLDDLTDAMNRFRTAVAVSGADVETWGQKFKKAFANQVRSALASLITIDLGQILKGVYDNVVALDDAVVNLQIASGKSRTETKALVKEYAALAKQLKATTAEVSASADTWLRQGYSAKEAETLITNSMMLSKLGQIESEEAATALTSAMKGYKVAVEDTVNIVDKLTAVDMEAAASAGGIATAMAETAAGAGLAGVSMDKLIGYLAVVKEVTQDADESVGTFFRTLFSRMGNIKVGKYVDEDGESLNDVETVLGELGIKLRESNDEFRNFSDVLDEVGKKWNDFSEVDKNAVASALAGTKQREKLIVLMDNYGTSLKYAATAAESAGTATQKYEAYTEGVTGSIQELKAAFEEFSLKALDSDFVTQFLDLGIELVEICSSVVSLIDALGGLNTVLVSTLGIIAAIKSHKIVSSVESVGSSIRILATFLAAHKKRGTFSFDSLAKELKRVGIEASATSIKFSLVSAAITAAIAAVNAYNSAMEQKAASNIQSANEHLEAARSVESNLEELISEYEDIYKSSDGMFDADQITKVKNIQEDIKDLVGEHANNLELVNGQLDDELEKLDKIRSKTREISKAEAEEALTDAENAIRAKTNTFGKTFDFRGKDLNAALEKYGGDVATTWDYTGGLFGNVDELITGNFEFSDLLTPSIYGQLRLKEPQNAAEFVAQYEAIKKLKTDIGSGDDDKLKKSDLYEELGDYISHYQDVYDTYVSAKKAVEEISNKTPSGGGSTGGGDDIDVDKIIDGLMVTKEGLDELLDRYKELIEIRKELLKTYAKELEYQKELEKKQQKAASLQTKLAIARLDDSAAGQARVRELEAQLEEAQNDLEDFTLEHAIEEIIEGIDNQYIEYEAFISAEIDKITKKIDELKDGKPPEEDPRDSFDERALLYELKQAMNADIRTDREQNNGANVQTIRNHYGAFWDAIMAQANQGKYDIALELFDKIMTMRYPMLNMYHTGGFVGGVPTLANNEEFAKLLEGEFVSTPSQIKNFMTRTLPQLTSFNSSGGYEFHAPLVEIKCESVTSESMPKLKEIVDEAVGEIKRCLDGGMSRTGYKRSVKKLLT